jgi:hypothetical protein
MKRWKEWAIWGIGALGHGQWQFIYLWRHRIRTTVLHFINFTPWFVRRRRKRSPDLQVHYREVTIEL